MNTRALNALAGVICRAQEQDRTPMGIAFAVDAAGMHMSPETAAELERLTARVAELGQQVDRLDHLDRITLPELRREIEHHKDGKARWRKRAEAAEARVAELETERHSTNEALADVTVAQRAEESAAELTAPSDEREVARRSVDRAFPAVAEFLTDGVTRLNVPLQALREPDGCPRNVIEGDVGGHFFKKGAFADSPVRCTYCGAKQPETGGAS